MKRCASCGAKVRVRDAHCFFCGPEESTEERMPIPRATRFFGGDAVPYNQRVSYAKD